MSKPSWTDSELLRSGLICKHGVVERWFVSQKRIWSLLSGQRYGFISLSLNVSLFLSFFSPFIRYPKVPSPAGNKEGVVGMHGTTCVEEWKERGVFRTGHQAGAKHRYDVTPKLTPPCVVVDFSRALLIGHGYLSTLQIQVRVYKVVSTSTYDMASGYFLLGKAKKSEHPEAIFFFSPSGGERNERNEN